jgi:hypothetical protein
MHQVEYLHSTLHGIRQAAVCDEWLDDELIRTISSTVTDN